MRGGGEPAATYVAVAVLGAAFGLPAATSIASSASSNAAPTSTTDPTAGKIKHVIVIMQENRSFDSYFGTFPHANGIPPGVCVPDPASGGCIAPYHDTLVSNFGGPHAAEHALADIDGGKMD